MRFVDYSPSLITEQLAFDEALLYEREHDGGEAILRVWEPHSVFVVLGYTNHAEHEVNLSLCHRRGIPIFRRITGGGTVVQGPGCLNFSLILEIPPSGPLSSAGGTSRFVLERHAEVIGRLSGESVMPEGISDLTIGTRKFSGNAQRRLGHWLLYHGTFLLNVDLSLIEELLPMPSRQPAYRGNRSHTMFLRNLGLPSDALRPALREAWGAAMLQSSLPLEETRRLSRERYAEPAWTLK